MTPQGGDDATAQTCLEMLRAGTRAEKITARLTLAEIFERRDQYVEAVELLERCRSEGFEDIELHGSLARLYGRLGRPSPANKARRRAEQMRRDINRSHRQVRWDAWGQVGVAVVLIVFGVGGTYASAWAAPYVGGRFFIFYGAVIAGVIMLGRLLLYALARRFPRRR